MYGEVVDAERSVVLRACSYLIQDFHSLFANGRGAGCHLEGGRTAYDRIR